VNPKPPPDTLDPPERELESALAGLRPAPSSSGREDVLFRAGYEVGWRDARSGLRGWRMACGGLAGLAAALLVALLLRPGPEVREHIVYVDRPAAVAPEQRSPAVVVRTAPEKSPRTIATDMDAGWLRMVWTPGQPGAVQATPVRPDPLAAVQRLDDDQESTISPGQAPAAVRAIRFRRALGLGPEDVGGEAAYRVMTRGAGAASSL
jgi:hypothetical protein